MKSSIFAVLFFPVFTTFMSAPLHAQPALLGLRAPAQVPEQTSAGPQTVDPLLQSPLQGPPQPGPTPPATLVLPAGTIITVEASEVLSSNKQHAGDNFVAELQQPLVVDGWVVARPGQTVMGRIAEAKKAGRVKGTSKLSLELQQIVLVDGLQVPVQSELVDNSGPRSHGRDLAAVAITTGVGAAVGAVCGGKGAAIGAAAGAAAGIAGVLLTRGEKTVIGPEKLLTFRLSAPLIVSTEQSQRSFWPVTPDDYIVPEDTVGNTQGSPVPVVISQPVPNRIPIMVWPEMQGLSVGRPGNRECGS